MSKFTTEVSGRRIWIVGNTYPVRQILNDAGCTFDWDRKQYYIGSSKAAKIAAVIEKLNNSEPPKEDLSSNRVYSKVKYKGKQYYCIAEGKDRFRLTVLDGSISFWADRSLCEVIKTYQVQTRFGGYGRGQVEVYTTLGSISRFIEQQKNPDTARGECTECGSWGPRGEPCKDCGGEGNYY